MSKGMMCRLALTLGVLLTLLMGPQSARAGASASRDRRTFTAALAAIRPGMTERQVLRVLGPPDDVRTETDPGGIPTTGTDKVLRYGANGHLSCATLGQVYLNQARIVQYVFGGRGAPPPATLIGEPELSGLLARLCKVGSYNSGYQYNPLPVIRAVNALRAVGRERALAAIAEYLRISSYLDEPAREGTFLVMRTLFDAPPSSGGMPRMGVGAPSPPEPKDPHVAPRFPIVIADDIPVLGVLGYTLAGMAERPEDHLAWFRAHGVLRAAPLRPTDRPLEALDRLLLEYRSDPVLPTVFVNQFLALLESVHRVEHGPGGLRFDPGRSFDSTWSDVRTELAKLRVRWDPESLRYVFADGTALPDDPGSVYRRVLWPFQLPTGRGRLAIERVDRRFVHIEVRAPLRHLVVGVQNRAGSVLPGLAATGAVSEGQGRVESIDDQTVALPEGEAIRVEIEAARIRVTSPEFRP
jgi:hypothetical protein